MSNLINTPLKVISLFIQLALCNISYHPRGCLVAYDIDPLEGARGELIDEVLCARIDWLEAVQQHAGVGAAHRQTAVYQALNTH